MKKLIIAVMLLLALTIVCACGDDEVVPETYDLVYATWNLGTEEGNNIERRMIAAFEEKYDVKIKIEDSISLSAYDDSIVGLAVKGNMPDVFMLSNINFGLSNKYLADISDLVGADKEWSNIPSPVESAVHYKSGIYAIPFAIHMMGYFVNVDLCEDYNTDILEVSPDYNEFYEVVKSFAGYRNEGVIGLSHENTILEWYAASINQNMGWFTWDGEKYNLNSDEFKEAMAKTREMYTNRYTFDSLDSEERLALYNGIDNYVDLWNMGKLAIRWGESYAIPDMLKNVNGAFDIKFIGVPGGRVPIVGDYVGISTTCQNRELAYKFSKWMSFSEEGIRARLSLDTDNVEFNTLPMTTNEELIALYFNKNNAVDGLKEAYLAMNNGIVEGVKVVPGYTRSRWTADTGVAVGELATTNVGELIDQCWRGSLSYADYAAQLNNLANLQYANAVKKYQELYN
ncbi:MAG: extracellular solute-binding protein [Clostridia bacterium]|nr:extracellular solute-binding protein [Clostridia bacterium]